jgi:hypothetical protein
MAQVLKILMAGQQKPQLGRPSAPASVPPGPGHSPTLVGKHTGAANLGNLIGTTVQYAIHQDKQKKLAAAVSDWNDLNTSVQKYIQPDGSIDQKAYQDPAVMQILGDPKKLKLMAKSLNQDWLNPKPDLYADARKIALEQHGKKQGAIEGLQQTIGKMLETIRGQGKNQQQQQTPDQQQAMAKDVMSRAPMKMPTQDPSATKEAMSVLLEQMKQEGKEREENQKQMYEMQRDAQKQKFTQFNENQKQVFQTSMKKMEILAQDQLEQKREDARLRDIGITLSARDKKLMGSVKTADIQKQLTGTIGDLQKQYAQAQREYLQMQKEVQSKGFWKSAATKVGLSDDPDVSAAQTQVKGLGAAIAYLDKNKAKIIKGDIDVGDAVEQAQKIASGVDLSDLDGTPVN